jgi:hypothetical protein
VKTKATAIITENREEQLQLSALANRTILKLEAKRKPLTPGEQQELAFAHRLWEACKQLNCSF